MTSRTANPPSSARPKRTGHAPARAGIILATLILGAIVANINTSISNVALPSIGRALQASDMQLTAITDAYQLGIAATVLYLGAVGDRHGRRKLLVIGAFLCIPFSLVSAFAPNATILIAAQICVGVAGAMLYPTTLSLISSLWSGSRMTAAIALWSGVGIGTSVLGPIFGGWLLNEYWWGSVFLITVPFAAAVFVLGLVVLPHKAGETDDAVDHPGGALSVIMIGSFVLAIVIMPQGLTPAVWILFGAAIISGIVFVLRELRTHNPLFDLRAAAIPTFWVSFVAALIAFGALVGAMFIGQQFTQNVLGQEAFTATLLTLGLTVGLFPTSIAAGRMIEVRGTRSTFMLGLAIVAIGFIEMLALWNPGVSLLWVVVAYVLVGAGIGFAGTAASHSLSASLPISKAGMSSASVDLTKDLGGAVFQALLGTLLAIAYSEYFARAFSTMPAEQAQALGNRAAQEIGSSYEGAQAVAATLPQADASELLEAAAKAFTEGKSAAILCALGSVLIGLALVWWKYPRLATEREMFDDVSKENLAQAAAARP